MVSSQRVSHSEPRTGNCERRTFVLLSTAILLVGLRAIADDPQPEPRLASSVEEKVDFVRDVRPILAKNCYACHGPEKQKSGLRLDRKKEASAGGDSGSPFEPGRSTESELIERVSAIDPDRVMPPKGERLTAREINILRDWIDQGANWPDGVDDASIAIQTSHWAFQAPRKPAVPTVKNASGVRNQIDAFVLARLEKEQIAPSAEADRPTLIRRLSLDLRGLPPTPEEVAAFLDDPSDDAYDRLVDKLLSSPHYGERWGRHWLDLARYADSDGYEKDTGRPFAWRYRDWVINALNRDLPFDQFTIQQIAGDLLPDASVDQKIATGFHRNTLTNKEGGVDQEEFRVAAVVDRTNTTGTVWLGLTAGCAQCHTHKYDPILQKEYYSLFAFFNTGKEVDLPAPLPGEQETYSAAKASFDKDHAPRLAALRAYDAETRPSRQAEWEKSQPRATTTWTLLEPVEMTSSNGATLTKQTDNSILVSGQNPETDVYTIAVETTLRDISAFRVEALDDRSLGGKGPGRTPHGNFVLSEIRVSSTPRCELEAGGEIRLENASADYSQSQFPASAAIDNDEKTGWAVDPAFGRRHLMVFESKEDLPNSLGTRLTFRLEQQHGLKHTLGRFRLSATSARRPVRADDRPDDIGPILAKTADQRSEAEKTRLAAYHRIVDPEYRRLNALVADHQKNGPKAPGSKAQTLAENPSPPKTHVHIRGDFQRKGDEVQPGVPSFLPPLKVAGATPTRLDLARWLVDPSNPLTARVAVNRYWRHLFGRPLVLSVDDFGTRGEKPSHPELLDWLAAEFPARGWSQKQMIKLIVTSATYRQSSNARPELQDRDSTNVWLSHQNRFRPEAEIVRDMTLAASGLLSPTVGGPSVHPPQPPGISELSYAGSVKWVESTGADRYRRGMYTWFQRTSPYPMLMTFDAPDSNVCAAKRERSNTPLQALTLLNDSTFVECAQGLGRRVVGGEGCGCSGCRIDEIYRVCLSREPGDDERPVLEKLYETLLRGFQKDPKAAEKLVGPNPPEKADIADLAAWVAVARTILNTDEFVTRE
jgi:hypothetical protein